MFHVKHTMMNSIIVVGEAAGVEAACVAARMGLHVAYVTFDGATMGHECNPAIGGWGKATCARSRWRSMVCWHARQMQRIHTAC
jgi:tRNA U34 5-carboxymethylaminomethyl modifying enzyme MnmG/GidA